MGRIACPCTSFSTTMGMFVTGSIIRPRIFISTSMKASLGHCHVLAHQTVRRRSRYANLNVGSQKFMRRGSEIYHAMRTGISRPLVLAARFSANQYLKRASNHRLALGGLDFPLALLQNCQPPSLLFLWNRIVHVQSGRVRPRRVLEREHRVVLHFLNQTQGLVEIGLRLTRETNDDVRGNSNWPFR